jgi:hypothetical protein
VTLIKETVNVANAADLRRQAERKLRAQKKKTPSTLEIEADKIGRAHV